jgi:serine/threonine protein phosphatase PrpC
MLEIDASVVTNVGRVRTNNEDSVCLIRPSHKAPLSSHGVLALLADGMGGHEGGELASKLAMEGIARSYYSSMGPPPEALDEALRTANGEVYQASRKRSALRGMGTTCVAVVLRDDRAWWAWVGDSRLYLLRSGQIYQMSEDHTVVHQLVRKGLLTPEEAYNHPDRSVLERAIGTRVQVEPSIGKEPIYLASGDRLLLCSDGLHDLITNDEIVAHAASGPIAECAEGLIDLALERGGFDNVSVILLELRDESTTVGRQLAVTREHIPL